MVDKLAVLKELRSRIPGMDCVPGCTACCGLASFSRFEWDLLPAAVRKGYDRFRLNCGFCDKRAGVCTIFEDRPISCRLLGVVENLYCPAGITPPNMLSVAEAAEIIKIYHEVFFENELI